MSRAVDTRIVFLLVLVVWMVAWNEASAQSQSIVIEHLTVLPMTADAAQPLPNTTVIIRNGRIESIARDGAAKLPARARRIDGTGKWLMPALADAHVHTENDRIAGLLIKSAKIAPGTFRPQDGLLPYVANGVLQVTDMSAMPESIAFRDEVERGKLLGPHIALAAMIDGSPPIWPPGMTRVAAAPEQGRKAVRDIKAEGYDLVKVYSRLDFETFDAIVDEAGKQGLKVLGHIPGRGKYITEKFLRPGFGMVAHAEEFAFQVEELSDDKAIADFAQLAKRNGVWLTATLTLDERIIEQVRDPGTLKTRPELRYVNPVLREYWTNHNPYVGASTHRSEALEKVVAFNRRLVRAFAQAGVPILAGTDSLVPGVIPGFALHDELVALSSAGLSNQQVLASATRLPAEWLGVAGDRGTVERGKRADLLLLDANPLEDVSNTRKIAAVIVRGRYLPRAELDKMMSALADRYAAMGGK
jgi:imidazolonepropionase-like amidohydrolase